jgi:hypothetical protein
MRAARPVLHTFHWQLLQQMLDPIRNYYNIFIPTEQRAVALFIFRWLCDDIFTNNQTLLAQYLSTLEEVT